MATTPFLFRPSSSSTSMENNFSINNTSPPAKEEVINGDEEMVRSHETVLKHKRKNGKHNQQKKKEPQRGLGVEKLERLRLADRIKALQEIGALQAQQVPFQYQQYPLAYRGGSFSPTNYGGQDLGGSFTPYRFSHGGFGFPDKPSLVPVQPDQGMNMMNYAEPAKELSSIQMMHCLSDNCHFCSKKRQSAEMMLGEYEEKPKMEMNGYDSLGLSLGLSKNIDEDIKPFDEGVEVMAVHRKKNAVIGGGVVMEYKFFPAYNNNNTGNSNSCSVFNTDSSEASASTPPTNAQFLDLSLKLSC